MTKNKNVIALWLLLCGVGFCSCADSMVYRDRTATPEARADDLLSRMTLEEKVMQVTQWTYGKNMNENNVETQMKAVSPMIGSLLYRSTSPVYYNQIQRKAVEESRLGIPILTGFDMIHGYRTIFPIPLAQACAWNESLIEESCRIGAREARLSGVFWTFSPMVDVARDSRWGRVSEGYGEDPYLTGMLGAAAVRGYQGDDLTRKDAVAACLKHFVGYAHSDGGRDYHYTEISQQTLWDTALPPFEMGVKAGAATVMSAFNDISGVPASANRYMMTDVLREKWGFGGFVVSDWGAVSQLIPQGVAANDAEACEKAFMAGLDMDMVDDVYLRELPGLIADGTIPGRALDEAVRRILLVKFRLGLFDDPYIEELPDQERYLSSGAHAVARELAAESMVLLKNDAQTLPVRSGVKRIALIGPMADNRVDLMGSWWGQGEADDVVTILEGLKAEFAGKAQIVYHAGCDFDGKDRSQFARALEVARSADLVVLCVGERRNWSGENASRASLALPAIQEDLVREMARCGRPVVVLVSSGRPVELRNIEPVADAMVAIWQPGTEGGCAVAQLLSGKVNPSGRLAITFPLNAEQQPVYYNQRQAARPRSGRYQNLPHAPMYPFGYGLSYTIYDYGKVHLDKQTLRRGERLVAQIEVTNGGMVDGKETVMWFISDPVASVSRPVKELKHFEKQFIPAGESRIFRFEIDPVRDLSFPDATGERLLERGEFYLHVNDQKVKFELN
ncbi:glycoside hydrolase family 3 N-terminal domain-containing protein [uncultured Alistipes sp.]|uniref:glycoside hydrolase family 3 N-terminal domain-containing protein n=1 Tax=uncultured Alistipes sp. TaxID=538949 RepID=UPI0025DF52C9|nr:glycoside hydrolase family 3 N-terminal domain-containing protein [uncultured Alistipes sp.]